MVRRALILAAVTGALVFAVAQASGSGQRKEQGCHPIPSPSKHWDAVFFHVTSKSQAIPYLRKLQHIGFTDIQLEKDACDDLEIGFTGVDSPNSRTTIAQEAMQGGRTVSFEPPDIAKGSRDGIVKAVFGTLPTLSRANNLQLDMAWHGFREGSDIERLGLHSWRVVVYNLPVSSESSFAAEATAVGYHVTFVPQ
jgi:hypothetical protein